jgi:ATP-dependent HslUV protease subunit HslV
MVPQKFAGCIIIKLLQGLQGLLLMPLPCVNDLRQNLKNFAAISAGRHSFIISGTGDVIEPDDGILAIGSGGSYALAAARALVKHSDLNAREIAEEAMNIASSICIYTNSNIIVEELEE